MLHVSLLPDSNWPLYSELFRLLHKQLLPSHLPQNRQLNIPYDSCPEEQTHAQSTVQLKYPNMLRSSNAHDQRARLRNSSRLGFRARWLDREAERMKWGYTRAYRPPVHVRKSVGSACSTITLNTSHNTSHNISHNTSLTQMAQVSSNQDLSSLFLWKMNASGNSCTARCTTAPWMDVPESWYSQNQDRSTRSLNS